MSLRSGLTTSATAYGPPTPRLRRAGSCGTGFARVFDVRAEALTHNQGKQVPRLPSRRARGQARNDNLKGMHDGGVSLGMAQDSPLRSEEPVLPKLGNRAGGRVGVG